MQTVDEREKISKKNEAVKLWVRDKSLYLIDNPHSPDLPTVCQLQKYTYNLVFNHWYWLWVPIESRDFIGAYKWENLEETIVRLLMKIKYWQGGGTKLGWHSNIPCTPIFVLGKGESQKSR